MTARLVDIEEMGATSALFEHCGEPMAFSRLRTTWEGPPEGGYTITSFRWSCRCGASAETVTRVPS